MKLKYDELILIFVFHFNLRLYNQEGPDSPFNLLRKDITRFLTTILIGSTCSGIGSAALASQAAMHMYGESAIGITTVLLTLVTLIFCEIAPKSIAVQHATAVARVVIQPIALLSILVFPVGRICTGLVNGVFALLNIKVGPGYHCSPRHRLPSITTRGSKCVG